MKRHMGNVLLKLSILGVFAVVASSVHGQSLTHSVRANIPFDFTVGNRKMPAGTYLVARALNRSDDTVIQITATQDGVHAIRMTSSVRVLSPKTKSSLVFHRYGDEYFLFQIWPAGDSTGRQLIKSSGERDIERKLASNKVVKGDTRVETVNVAATMQ